MSYTEERDATTTQAAAWLVANDDGPLDERASAEFVAWLTAAPENVEEFLGVSVIARDLRAACSEPGPALSAPRAADAGREESFGARLLEGLRGRPGWQVGLAMMLVAVTGLGWVSWQMLRSVPGVAPAPAPAVAEERFQSGHGEQQVHRLADGSVLHLNTDSAVVVRYSKSERLVTLSAGEASFEVTHASDRPFRVLGGTAEIVDLGTRFDVRLDSRTTIVTVLEGKVAVGRALDAGSAAAPAPVQPAREFVTLTADQQLRVEPGSWPATPVAVDAQRATAWLRRQIMFEDEPLDQVASEFNRYAAKPIEVRASQLRGLKISGVFATDNSAAFVAFLRTLDGVRVEETPTSIIVAQK
jgi:transmembrane sensor